MLQRSLSRTFASCIWFSRWLSQRTRETDYGPFVACERPSTWRKGLPFWRRGTCTPWTRDSERYFMHCRIQVLSDFKYNSQGPVPRTLNSILSCQFLEISHSTSSDRQVRFRNTTWTCLHWNQWGNSRWCGALLAGKYRPRRVRSQYADYLPQSVGISRTCEICCSGSSSVTWRLRQRI